VKTPPGDAAQAVVTVTLEAPMPLKAFNANAAAAATLNLNVPLSADLSFPNGNSILWKPAQAGAELGNVLAVLVAEQIQRVRLGVHLRGAGIWLDNPNTRAYLDGRTLGQDGFRADGTPRIDLLFPSGEGSRSSDFDSWLYVQLQLPPSTLVGLTIAPNLVNSGGGATGTVTLDHPAPAAGVTIALTSSSTVVGLPANVQVPAGQTTATFNVTTTAAPNTLSVIITGTGTGVTLTAPLTVQVVSVSVSPAEVTIFTGHSQQFSATVIGTSTTDVTWSVQEPSGASVSASGLFIGSTAGDYHVIATSTADTSKNGTGLVHVRDKTKDKEKEKEKDKEKEIEKTRDKLSISKEIAKEIEILPQDRLSGRTVSTSGTGRAFISPTLRPSTP
jgi:hypothetical protein